MKLKFMPRARAAGFVIPSAIFLVVILALLAAFLVRLSTTQDATSTQDIQGTRAYHAARAGIDILLYRVADPQRATLNAIQAPIGVGAAIWPNHPNCPGNTTQTIAGFTVVMNCVEVNPLPPFNPPDGTMEGVGPCTSGETQRLVGMPLFTRNTPACAERSIRLYTLTARASQGVQRTPSFVEREIVTTLSHCRNKDAASGYSCP